MNLTSLKSKITNNQLIKDSFWSLFGNVIAKGLALVTGVLVARFLGKDIYGEYGIIKNTIMAISVFSTFGLGYTATKFVAEYKAKKIQLIPVILKYITQITLVFSGVMALLLMVFSKYIAQVVLEAPNLIQALRLLAVLIVFNAITTTQIGVLAGFGKFKQLARINSLIAVITFILTVPLTYFYGLNGALIGLLIVQILNCLLNFIAVRQNVKTHEVAVAANKRLLKEILIFSTPVALQEALYSLTQWLSALLLIRYTSFGELGMYTAAMQWNAIILFIPGILCNVILSHLAGASQDKKKHDKIMKTTLAINLGVTLSLSIFVLLFGGFISSFYGASFNGLEGIISLAVFTTIFSSMSNVYTQAYISKGLNWQMFSFKLIRDTGIVLIAYIFLNKIIFNFEGAYALIISFLILNIAFFVLVVLYYRLFIVKKNE